MISFVFLKISEEERAAKQSEVTLLMDEVERAQTRLLSLEREKVQYTKLNMIKENVTYITV